jgi:hypothetical protein
MDNNFKIEEKQLLLVEGKDECNFFKELLKHEGIEGVQWVDIGGKDKFPIEFPLLVNMEGFKNVLTIGLVRDAEANKAESAFQSLCSTLRDYNLPVPSTINSLNPGPPKKVGIFIMPDNQGAGMLETLCLKTLEGQDIEKCLDDYLSCVSTIMAPSEKKQFNEPKAKVQAYLAARVPIVNSLGLGAKKGYWDFSHPCFEEIKQFLHSLFDADGEPA